MNIFNKHFKKSDFLSKEYRLKVQKNKHANSVKRTSHILAKSLNNMALLAPHIDLHINIIKLLSTASNRKRYLTQRNNEDSTF
jgi:hypothetical protein